MEELKNIYQAQIKVENIAIIAFLNDVITNDEYEEINMVGRLIEDIVDTRYGEEIGLQWFNEGNKQ
jgi:hypothetical protein